MDGSEPSLFPPSAQSEWEEERAQGSLITQTQGVRAPRVCSGRAEAKLSQMLLKAWSASVEAERGSVSQCVSQCVCVCQGQINLDTGNCLPDYCLESSVLK